MNIEEMMELTEGQNVTSPRYAGIKERLEWEELKNEMDLAVNGEGQIGEDEVLIEISWLQRIRKCDVKVVPEQELDRVTPSTS